MSSVSESIAGSEQPEAGLVDVVSVPLADVVNAPGNSPILRSIERLQANLDDPDGVLSAFSSFIDES